MIVLRARQLIDGTGNPPVRDAAILVEGTRIARVGSATQLELPKSAEVIDLGDATLLPGLFECHTHLSAGSTLDSESIVLEATDADLAFRMAKSARILLQSGVTTARIAGERNYLDFAYRRAWEVGLLSGPRIVLAGPGLQATHGHGSVAVVADGVDEVRRAVRRNIKAGVDFIKIFITGGTGTVGTPVSTCYYTDAEIEAAIEEAHRVGKLIEAHAHGGHGAKVAVKAGIDILAHGAFMDEELITLLAQHQVWLNPNLALYFRTPKSNERPLAAEVASKRAQARENLEAMFPKAIDAGVKILAGTDGCHGEMWFELACLVQLGLSPMQAIIAATRSGARACGLQDQLGTLEVGKVADVIAVKGDPLLDITALSDVRLVMQGGRSYRFGD